VDPRAGMDDEKRKFLTLPGLELRPVGRQARSQSLYTLCYPGSNLDVCDIIILKSVFGKLAVKVWNGFIWLRIESTGGRLKWC
jgi:hypothetical protein